MEPEKPEEGVRVANRVLGLAVTMIGVFAWVDASDLDMFGEHGVPGPGFLPKLLSGLLVALGLLLTALTLVRRQPAATEPADAEPGFEVSGLLRAGRVWIGLLVSVPVMTLIGFVPAMVLLMAYLVFGVERMTGIRPVLVTILVPALTYAIFAFLLGVDLPASELFGRS
jgi:hypothetical protein